MTRIGGWRVGLIALSVAIVGAMTAATGTPHGTGSPVVTPEPVAFASMGRAVPPGPAHAAQPPRPRVGQVPILNAPVAPASAPDRVAAAPDGLDVATGARYVVDPVARVVRVSVDVTAVNRLPVTPGARYYYPGVNLAVQPEGRQFVVDEGGTPDATATEARTGYSVLTIQFADRLYVGQTAHLTVTYVLPAGAPRSSSQVRVGAAYTTFVAWAFGDRGTVEVDVPAPYAVGTSGDAMQEGSTSDGGHALTASAADPGSWYAWIDARNDSALTTTSLQLPGGEQVVVRAWPEDPTWARDVSKTLSTAIPALASRIGLPWPVSGQLSVLEVSGALLEGYAGFYSAGNQQITISEAVDPFTVVHEASHAWFNASLFMERWLTEGLADEYAYRTLAGLGVAVDGPAKVKANAPVAFALDTWGTPAPIKTRTQDAREQWGYQASWTVVRAVVGKLGEAKMALVLAAAKAAATAYPAGSIAERTTRPADWRRFVDLAEEVGGGRGIAELIAPWVLTPAERGLLAPRAAARTAYHDLVAQDGDWTAPVVVRMDLDAWDFAGASTAIAEAAAVLGVRDAIRAEATQEHLTVPVALEPAYETASSPDALAKVADDALALRHSLDAVAGARTALQAPRDWLATLGLLGQDLSGALDAARTAWTSGDASAATAEAAAVIGALAVADDAGRLRLVAIAAAIIALLLLGILAGAIVRRRSRQRRPALAAAGASRPSAGHAWTAASATGAPEASTAGVTSPSPAAAPPPEERIDPAFAPPPAPPWWRPAVLPEPPDPPGPYPILPANAAARPTPRSSADRDDEGAQ